MISKIIADYIKNLKYEDIPQDVIDFTKLCILDWLGNAIAGRNEKPVQIFHQFVNELGGNADSTLITGGKSSIVNAALVNAAASHVIELDDVHKGSIIHGATVVIPAALSVAEANNKTGKELIAAVVVGYDLCFRIGEAVSPSHYYYWHNTATCGTFGAMAAAARLLDLSEDQIVHAVGSAGTQAAGLWEFIEDGAMSKQLHTAKAAANGVMAALLAEKGLTGATKILEGKRGFINAMSDHSDISKITNQLGEIYKITENSFKIYASCRHTHPSVGLLIDLANRHNINSEDVKSLEISTYQVALNITDNPDPRTLYAAKFSSQFCAALAIHKRAAGLHDFNGESLWNQEVRSLMQRVTLKVNPTIDQAYPEKWGADVKIQLVDGTIVQDNIQSPKGDPENNVTPEELIKKFMSLTNTLDPLKTNTYFERVMQLEQFDSIKDILA